MVHKGNVVLHGMASAWRLHGICMAWQGITHASCTSQALTLRYGALCSAASWASSMLYRTSNSCRPCGCGLRCITAWAMACRCQPGADACSKCLGLLDLCGTRPRQECKYAGVFSRTRYLCQLCVNMPCRVNLQPFDFPRIDIACDNHTMPDRLQRQLISSAALTCTPHMTMLSRISLICPSNLPTAMLTCVTGKQTYALFRCR
jgi:hypothetical protein